MKYNGRPVEYIKVDVVVDLCGIHTAEGMTDAIWGALDSGDYNISKISFADSDDPELDVSENGYDVEIQED